MSVHEEQRKMREELVEIFSDMWRKLVVGGYPTQMILDRAEIYGLVSRTEDFTFADVYEADSARGVGR